MKVTTKGQVTIPARIREHLGISAHSEVEFRIRDGSVVLVKSDAESGAEGRFAALRGVLAGKLSTRRWMAETRGD